MKRGKTSKNSSSTDDLFLSDDAQCPPPLFLLVRFTWDEDINYSIIHLKPQSEYEENDNSPKEDDLKFEAVCFKLPLDCQKAYWVFTPPTTCTEDLFMVPQRFPYKPLNAYQFNFRTADFVKITPPHSGKCAGRVVNLNGSIYYIEQPEVWYEDPEFAFECYDPDLEQWSALTPFPDPPNTCRIQSIAVWGDDTILYNIAYLTHSSTGSILMDVGSFHMWAYVVSLDKWYEVEQDEVDEDEVDEDDDGLLSTIFGEMVVQGETIYCLTDQFDLLLALSIEDKLIDGDYVFKCSLLSKISMPGVKPLIDWYDAWIRSRRLVHLGPDYFCIVQCCEPRLYRRCQPIQLTYMKLEGEKMRMTYERVFEWAIHPKERFHVLHCFPLPKGMTTALEEGKRFDFKLVPEPEAAKPVKVQSWDDDALAELEASASSIRAMLKSRPFDPLKKLGRFKPMPSLADIPKIVEEKKLVALFRARDKEGHSIVVSNLPKNANVTQVEKELKKEFGPIKKGRTEVKKNSKGKCHAYVEFESEASKQRAIETGTITIGDRPAKIS